MYVIEGGKGREKDCDKKYAAAQTNMAWPFLTDILRRKLWCSGPSAPVPWRQAPPTGHPSEPGSTCAHTFSSSSLSYLHSLTHSPTHFSTELKVYVLHAYLSV